MTIESCLRVVGTLIGDADLIDSIVVDGASCLRGLQHSCSKGVIGESHEDAIEPHLIAVDCFVPEHTIGFCTRLLFQLTHQGLHCDATSRLWVELVHTCHEMTCAYVVEVVFIESIALNVALSINHGVNIFFAIVENGRVFI